MTRPSRSHVLSTLAMLCLSLSAWAEGPPPCRDHGRPLPVNNSQVLHWKKETPNQYHARGHVTGTLLRVYQKSGSHTKLKLQVGARASDTIELVYNNEFGDLPELTKGASIEACGDYITSFAPSGPYQASPDGALVHWLHQNPQSDSHDDGYLVIDGYVTGQEDP